MNALSDYLDPRSIAIVGASDDPKRIGGRPLANMLTLGFEGAIYPVNPNHQRVQGLVAYPTLLDVPGKLDFVLIALAADGVADVMRQAARKHAKTAMIFSSGFAEVGAVGLAMQREVAAIARDSGMRVIGPNCLGAFNSAKHFYPTFTSTIDRATPRPGGISIASQSGAYGSHIYMASHLRGLGIRYWVTTGNEADLHVAEVIKQLAEHEDVDTIMAYAESIKDGPLLVDALETARANRKPVIFMKVGRSAEGAAAARSHTASLAGDDAIYDAVLRQHGAFRARSTEEMLDIAYACRPRIFPTGRKLGVVTISGGAGVLIADAAADAGLKISPMPAEAQEELKAVLPFAAPRNPIDVTAQFFNDLSLIPRFTKVMLEKGGYDGLLGFWTSVAGSPNLAEPLLASLKATGGCHDKTLFIQSVVASPEILQRYEEAGFPCFEDPTRAVRAMAAVMALGAGFAEGARKKPDIPSLPPLPEGPLDERTAIELLAEAGLPMVTSTLAQNAEEAGDLAEETAGPVAMKVASPDIAHKTEVGGVVLDVTGAEAATAAFGSLMRNAKKHAPGRHIDGVLISPLVSGGVECLLGAKIDPVFGPIVLFGLGGIFTEVLQDVAFRRAPIAPEFALGMIEDLQAAPLLKGARGRPACDLDALAQAIATLSCFAARHADAIESVEVNPLLALPKGCMGLDALIVKKEEAKQ